MTPGRSPAKLVTMPLESTITTSIKKAASAAGWWVMKIHGGPQQLAGVPDLLCIREGVTVWLEVKRPGCKPTPLQLVRMAEIERVGGVRCFVVTTRDEALCALAEAAGAGVQCRAAV